MLTFAGALEKGGVGARELVAMDMKARSVFFPDLMYHEIKSATEWVPITMCKLCYLNGELTRVHLSFSV